MKTLKGKLITGIGNYSYWIEKLSDFYKNKTGMKFFPGTLNVQLEEPYDLKTNIIRLEKEEYGGTVSVNLQKCKIFTKEAYILRTDKNASGDGIHPRTVIEIATDVKLRDYFNISDGSIVEIEVID